MTPVADCNLSTYLNLAAISQEKLTILRGFFGCLANALKYLHASQIRHRDIKPQNILVHGARVLLADFGIALDWGDLGGSTTTEDSGKTWVYAAPEVAQYQKRNSSADVWSLGCVFLEMATVLIGVKISAMRELFKGRNSDYRFYNNIDTTREWLKKLSGSTPIDETRPLNWIASMLQENADLRPSALALYNSITVCREFCGVCCREDHEPSDSPDDDDDDDDDPWAEDTLN
jgi:serine/threonine protein kinase